MTLAMRPRDNSAVRAQSRTSSAPRGFKVSQRLHRAVLEKLQEQSIHSNEYSMEAVMKFKSLLLGASLATITAFGAAAETWKLAVTDVEGMERLQLEWGPFKTALEDATGDTFEFFAVNSRTAA